MRSSSMSRMLPAAIADVAALETLLSEPTPHVVDTLRGIPGDIVVLGAAGKMGPTLARMARRAADLAGTTRRVVAVSRFTAGGRDALDAHGVETISCDLLDEASVASLPDAPNVIFMAGRKFGSTGDEPLTWAMNCHLPSIVCRRYRSSRIVAFCRLLRQIPPLFLESVPRFYRIARQGRALCRLWWYRPLQCR